MKSKNPVIVYQLASILHTAFPMFLKNKWHHFIGILRKSHGSRDLVLYLGINIGDSHALKSSIEQKKMNNCFRAWTAWILR